MPELDTIDAPLPAAVAIDTAALSSPLLHPMTEDRGVLWLALPPNESMDKEIFKSELIAHYGRKREFLASAFRDKFRIIQFL